MRNKSEFPEFSHSADETEAAQVVRKGFPQGKGGLNPLKTMGFPLSPQSFPPFYTVLVCAGREIFLHIFPTRQGAQKVGQTYFFPLYQWFGAVNEFFRNISRNFPRWKKAVKQAVFNIINRVFHGFEYSTVENPSAFCTRANYSPFHAVFVDPDEENERSTDKKDELKFKIAQEYLSVSDGSQKQSLRK